MRIPESALASSATLLTNNQALMLKQILDSSIEPVMRSINSLLQLYSSSINAEIIKTVQSFAIQIPKLLVDSQLIDLYLQRHREEITSLLKSFRTSECLRQIQVIQVQEMKTLLESIQSQQWVFHLDLLAGEINSPSLASVARQISELAPEIVANAGQQNLPITENVVRDLSFAITQAATNDYFEITDDFVDKLVVRLRSHLDSLPPSKVSAAGWMEILAVVLAILTLIYTIHSDQQTDKILNEQAHHQAEMVKILEQQSLADSTVADALQDQIKIQTESVGQAQVTNQKIDKLISIEEEVIGHIKRLAKEDQDQTMYVTIRLSVLRNEPSKTGHILARVYPNQMLQILQTTDRWAYVTYFDYNDGRAKRGWIYIKNIKNVRFSQP